MSPSFNHSYLQMRLGAALLGLNKYAVLSELSLDIQGKEYRPDICLYSQRKTNFLYDIVRMTEMPLLAIEILSMSQNVKEAVDKFEVYFEAGIPSCWLVMPFPHSVTVFNGLDQVATYTRGQIIDPKLDIELDFDHIFN
jgi:Uma2 family endonuclease